MIKKKSDSTELRRQLEEAQLKINQLEFQLQAFESQNAVSKAKDLARHIARQGRDKAKSYLQETPERWRGYENGSLEEFEHAGMDDLQRMIDSLHATDESNFRRTEVRKSIVRPHVYRLLSYIYRSSRNVVKWAYHTARKASR